MYTLTLFGPDGPTDRQIVCASASKGSEPTKMPGNGLENGPMQYKATH